MSDIDVLETQVRAQANEIRALKQTLWDQYFLAALPVMLNTWGGHGIGIAKSVADKALKVRNERAGVKS